MLVPRVVAVIAIALASAGAASAQDATGHIEGRVVTSDARPVASVRISATGPSLQLSRETETDSRGYFRLQDLPVGTYHVRLALVGSRPVRFDGVTVRLGLTTSLGQTTLVAQAFELGEIVVNAERPIVDVASAATVFSLPSEFFSYLPNERSVGSIVSLAPQANQSQFPGEQVNISGSSGPENAYYLDGMNISRGRFGIGNSELPYNFIREVQVKTGGYEAEFGRATGGIVDVITRSGGNRFGGEVFGYFTDNALTSEPRFALEGARQADFSEYDVGGSLGGPIVRDRLWFFAAYNPSFHRERVGVRGADIPDDHTTEHLFATKLTWRAGPQTDVVITAHGNPSRHRGVDLGSALDTTAETVTFLEQLGGVQLSALMRRRLGGSGQAEFGVSRLTIRFIVDDAAGRLDPHFVDYTTGVVSGGFGRSVNNRSARDGVHGSLRQVFGRHAMKLGVEYENNQNRQAVDNSADPGAPQGNIERYDETTYVWYRGRSGGLVHNRVLTAYAQDSWRSGDRLTLNYGVRWDAQYLIGPDGKLAQRFTDQWQPRAGFTYQVGPLGSQKLFGSYGRFYEQIPILLPTTFYNPFHQLALRYDHDPRIDPSGADTLYDFALTASEVPHPKSDLRGQSLDEFILGYERALGRQFRIGVRGIHRAIRWVIEDVLDDTFNSVLGNPGRGALSSTPRARRTYNALVLTFEKPTGEHLSFLASYVLSRRRGNYEGLSNGGALQPNFTPAFDNPELLPNSFGLLSNDRPNVLKLSGSYRFDFGLTAGTTLAWMSGTPRNEFGVTTYGDPGVYLQPRGSVGRTEPLFDASVRLTYVLRPWGESGLRPRVYLDVFHLGNRRTALNFEETHYLELDSEGNPTTPNPDYGRALDFQSPMSARIGLSLDFGVLDEGDVGGY